VAVIDPEPFRARRDQAASNLEMSKANVARAKTDLAQRKRELDRVKSLVAQQYVSQNTGIARSAVSDIERGVRRVDSLELKKIARLYSLPTTYFLDENADADVGEHHVAEIQIELPIRTAASTE
jgi:multidrug resistance efflux pump